MILPILMYPDPRLRTLARPIEDVEAVQELIDDMFETMYKAQGIGLAATQVDRHVRLVVMDLAQEDEPPAPRVFINPEVVALTEQCAPYNEGCLSIPEVYDEVMRPTSVLIRAQDRAGNAFEEKAEGLLAVCIQHEIDHLNGVMFVDYLSRLKQTRAIDKVRKVTKKKS